MIQIVLFRTLACAALAAALLFARPAAAQIAPGAGPAVLSIGSLDGPAIERLSDSIVRRVTTSEADPGARLRSIQSALDDLALVETLARRPASPDPRTDAVTRAAKGALLALATKAVDRDRLSRKAVEAETEWLRRGTLGPAELTAAFADLDRLSADIVDPAAKVEALIRIGGAHRELGNEDRAVRYGQLAERASRDMAAGPERDTALTAVLALATAGDAARTLGIAVAALAAFESGEARAAAVAEVARAAAPAPAAPDAVNRVRTGAFGIRETVWPVLASADPKLADDLRILATERMEDEVAVLLATARADAVSQDAALAEIVAAQVAQRRGFAALDTARLMLTSERQRHAAATARVLAEAGYHRIARSVAEAVVADPDADPDAVSTAGAALAAVDRQVRRPATLAEHAAAIRALPAEEADRERTAAAVEKAARGDLRATLEAIRAAGDYRLRVAGFRAVAEHRAAALDSEGRLTSRVMPPSGLAGTPDPEAAVLLQAAGLKVVAEDTVRVGTPDFVDMVPDLTVDADTVRRIVPVPLPGISELSLAGLNRFTQLNRFNSKFLEDVVGTTAREHIFKTQGTINPTFIYLTNGVFTARDLLHAIDTSSGSQLVRDNGVYMLRVPLVIGPDATLVLTGQDAPQFRISASAGAFVINAGKLFLVDTRLVGWDEEAEAPSLATYETKHEFRPFITTWSGSETYIAGSELVGLGYSAGKSYGITLSAGPKEGSRTLDLPRPKGLFVDSTFDNLLYGFYTYEADDVVVVGNEYKDSVVYGLDPHDRSNRLVMGLNTLYGTLKKHGAIFSRDVIHSHLIGNISFDNAGSGIMMDRRASLNWIYANTAIDNVQDGMTVYESSCLLIANNAFAGNGRSGVKIRNSWKVLVEGNLVSGNAGPGIESYVADLAASEAGALRDLHEDPYLQIASFAARGNTLIRNTVGITARDTSEIELSANAFIDQTPGVFDGQLKPIRAHLLQIAGGDTPVTVRPVERLGPEPHLAEEAGTQNCPPPARLPVLSAAAAAAAAEDAATDAEADDGEGS